MMPVFHVCPRSQDIMRATFQARCQDDAMGCVGDYIQRSRGGTEPGADPVHVSPEGHGSQSGPALTSSTALVNSVFDHSMLGATTHYAVYGCDKTVVAFTGTTAPFGPGYPILGVGCNEGYKVENVQFPPPISLAPDMSYSGWGSPGYLFYDGHPGIDYVAAMDTQVYAAANGTVHYPTRIVGLGYPAAAYHVLEIVPDHAGPTPPYVIYYLHLDTYVGQNKIPVTDPDPLPGCSGTVYLPLDEGTHVQAGCLIALSGKAAPPIFHYLPHLHFEVHKVVPS